ncbi:MAG: alanyl-tRNA editing protein [Holophagae bacterium]|jgi:alanyl-tRNA synthetase
MHRFRFQHDASCRELDTEVTEVGRDSGRAYAVTEDTIFYPEGGGQPADHGRMDDVEVVDVQMVDGVIRHSVAGELEPGPVHQVLDWDRRFDHMQQHSGQHLLTVVALQSFGWATTAFHMGPELSDIELDVASLDELDLRRLEDEVNEEIRAAHPITIRFASMDQLKALGVRSRLLPEGLSGEVRLVEIEGLDLNTCGGTHVRSTAEIGSVALIGTEPMRGGTRLFFVAGDRVRRRLAAHEARNRELRTLLDAADNDLPGLVELRLGREKELARDRRRLLVALARAEAERLASGEDRVASGHWSDGDLPFLQAIGKALLEIDPDRIALLTAGRPGDGCFLLVAAEATGVRVGTIGPEVCRILDGRGGGRAPFFQGMAASVGRRVEAVARVSNGSSPVPGDAGTGESEIVADDTSATTR